MSRGVRVRGATKATDRERKRNTLHGDMRQDMAQESFASRAQQSRRVEVRNRKVGRRGRREGERSSEGGRGKE